jgi:predicted ester cyclase
MITKVDAATDTALPGAVIDYFDAWTRHDAAGVAACFAPGGTFENPGSGGPQHGSALTAYARALFDVFPDVRFEVLGTSVCGDVVSVQWLMRATNTGPLLGLPATGLPIAVPGADFIVVEGSRLRSVRGYYDQSTVFEQLGLERCKGGEAWTHSIRLRMLAGAWVAASAR